MIEPQSRPWPAQLVGVHVTPHTFGVVSPQVCPLGQVPQFSGLPHVSVACPQSRPWAVQLFGVQTTLHTFGVTTPQIWPLGHAPQSSEWPQPSVAVPQSSPCCRQLEGEHAPPVPLLDDADDATAPPAPLELAALELVLLEVVLPEVPLPPVALPPVAPPPPLLEVVVAPPVPPLLAVDDEVAFVPLELSPLPLLVAVPKDRLPFPPQDAAPTTIAIHPIKIPKVRMPAG
jgi:hypothetical protein